MDSPKPTYEELSKRIEALEQELDTRIPAGSLSTDVFSVFNILQNAADSAWLINDKYELQYFNPKFEGEIKDLFDRDPAPGLSMLDLLPDSLDTLWKERYDTCLRGEQLSFIDHYNIKDGETFYDITLTPILHNGKVAGISCYGKDITELKVKESQLIQMTEEALKKEAYLETLINTLPDLIWLKDKDGVYIHCNRRFEDFFGARREEIIGKTDYDFCDKELADFFRENDRAAMQAGHSLLNEEQIQFASDGHFEDLETIKTPLHDEQGNIIGVLGVGRDITHRKKQEAELIKAKEEIEEREQKLKVAQKIAKVGHWELDFAANKLYWSDEVYRIFECDPETTEMTYDSFLSFIHPEDRSAVDKAYQKHLESKQAYKITHRILLKDKRVKYISENCLSEFDSQGNPIISRGTVSDITERENYQKALLQEKERAEESDRLKSMFLANLSHEIRTPMNAIMGFSSLLKREGLDEDQKDKYLDYIESGGKRLLRLISDIVDISKIDTNQLTIKEDKCDINALIEKLEQEFLLKVDPVQVRISTKKSLTSKRRNILIDEYRLIQILSNLIENSVKFTPKGMIEFGYFVDEKYIVFYVKDSGIGIAKKDQKHIFERFRQVDTQETGYIDGTGLGLSIVKSLTELMGGKIWLSSEPGKGTTFNIRFKYLPMH